ncbi:MAG: hypothetical protein JWP02_3861 [Acidimicrobiales bacterium]|nr:hypothetical protein [Acidimicrobiales bacterium]
MRRQVLVAGSIAALVLSLVGAPPARSAPTPTGTACSWPTRLDPTVGNTLYPDSAANYWITNLPAVPGETLTIRGQYPYGRYMSLTTYTPYLFSIDGLHDAAIAPDAGSSNPFVAGAERYATTPRNYTLTVVLGQKPAAPPPNTLYTTSADGSKTGTNFRLAYRVYRPDEGKDDRGGVPLPQVTVNMPGGQSFPLPQCDVPGFPPNGVNNVVANANGAPAGPPWPGTNPPTWHRFYNGLTSAATLTDNGVTGTQASDGANAQIMQQSSKGGFLDNPDNAYVYAGFSRGYGSVVVLHGKLPTFAATYPAAATMPGGTQLRYWSMCTYDVASERYYGCVPDDEVATDASGGFTIVVSDPSNRPANATAACGANWLPFGPAPESLAIMRNMLPDASFTNAIQSAGYGTEAKDLGAYYPAGLYTTKSAFEAKGCPSP